MAEIFAKVRIHRQCPTDLNPFVVVAAMVLDEGDISTYIKSFKRKRIESTCLLQRDMTPYEIEVAQGRWRIFWYRYKQWEGLLRDEWRATKSIDWLNELYRISNIKIPLEKLLGDLF